MSERPTEAECRFCSKRFPVPGSRGPIPRYCKPSCRQRAFEERRLERLIAEAVRAAKR